MTERIYYTDPSCRTFNAIVTRAFDHDGRLAVTLDRTAFYPTSGGQPFDTGRLGPADVLDTVDHDGDVVHVLSAALEPGTTVRGEIDWPRRFDHMQQHTGQHVLSAAFDRAFDNHTTSFHMGTDVSTIDLARPATSQEIERAVDDANEIVWASRPVSIRFVSAEEAARLPLRKEPVREGPLRLIEIPDVDLSACGGTHVALTGSIGMICVLGSERFKGGSRVTFACGGRALRALRTYRDAVAGSVRALSVLPPELPAAVERIQAESKELRKTLARQQASLAAHEGARLVAAATTDASGVRQIVEIIDGWDLAGMKAIAVSIVSGGQAVAALFSSSSPSAALIARSSDVPIDASAVLTKLMQTFGGRGGGKPDMAQGGGLTGDPQAMAARARELLRPT